MYIHACIYACTHPTLLEGPNLHEDVLYACLPEIRTVHASSYRSGPCPVRRSCLPARDTYRFGSLRDHTGRRRRRSKAGAPRLSVFRRGGAAVSGAARGLAATFLALALTVARAVTAVAHDIAVTVAGAATVVVVVVFDEGKEAFATRL
jgi:hypothetical protein